MSKSLDWRVLLFTFLISIFTGILFGLAPALHAPGGGRDGTGVRPAARPALSNFLGHRVGRWTPCFDLVLFDVGHALQHVPKPNWRDVVAVLNRQFAADVFELLEYGLDRGKLAGHGWRSFFASVP